jgi:6-phosphogluconolactonase
MIQVHSSAELLADAVAQHIVTSAAEAISSRGRFTLALAGGSTPRAAYSRLAVGDSRLATGDWRLFHILWGDERCVPPDDPRSNYRMA